MRRIFSSYNSKFVGLIMLLLNVGSLTTLRNFLRPSVVAAVMMINQVSYYCIIGVPTSTIYVIVIIGIPCLTRVVK